MTYLFVGWKCHFLKTENINIREQSMKKIISIILITTIFFSNPFLFFLQSAYAQVSYAGNTSDGFSEFYSLSDPELLRYTEESVYFNLVNDLDNEDYFVQDVRAIYISKEYLNEVAFNSQSNIFYGYTLAELDEHFQGKRYIFTLGDDGTTTVREFENFDDTYEKAIRNVAIGSGVIFICVTVSVISGALGAPAISMIFAASAKTAAEFALFSGILGGISAGIITGIETGDFSEALKAAALNGSERFKWGAISGAVIGGITELAGLSSSTLNGLTMDQAAIIQKESHWPLDAIRSIHSMEEYTIYKNAELIPIKLGNEWAFVREIDWNLVDTYGRTNLIRVQNGLNPIDASGKPYELHHIGQKPNSPLAILTNAEHHSSGNFSILHWRNEGKNVADEIWAEQKALFWKNYLAYLKIGG